MQLRLLLAILTALYLCHRSHMVQSSFVNKSQRASPGRLGAGSSRLLEGVAATRSRAKMRSESTSGQGNDLFARLLEEDEVKKVEHDEDERTSSLMYQQPEAPSSPPPPPPPPSPHKHRHGHHLITTANKFTARTFYLYNRCSGAHVQVVGKKISALADTTQTGSPDSLDQNQYATMTLRRQAFGKQVGVTIQARRAGVYLCFNKRGKLVTRFSGSSVNCLFTETPADNNYIRYASVFNPDWALGFNRKGRPLHEHISGPGLVGGEASTTASTRRHQKKCYQFVKRAAETEPPSEP